MAIATQPKPYRQSLPAVGGMPILMLILSLIVAAGVIFSFWDEKWLDAESFGYIFVVCLLAGFITVAIISSRFVLVIFLVAFFIRVIAAIFIYRFLYLDYGFRGFEGNDDLFWDRSAKILLSGSVSIEEALKDFFSAGYIVLVSGIYELAGYNPLTPRIVNALFGALVVIPGYYLAKELFNEERFSRLVAWWLALFPTLIIWSGAFHKDMLLCLCMTVGIYACVRMFKRGFSLSSGALLLAAVIGALLLRVFAGHTLIIVALVAMFYRAKRKSIVGGTVSIIFVLFLIAGVGVVVVNVMGRSEAVDFEGQYASRAEGFESSSAQIAGSKSAQGVAALLTSAPRPVRLLIGPVITLISPVPPGFAWKNNYGHSVMSIFQPLQVLLLPYFLLGLYRAVFLDKLRQTGLVLLIPAIALALIANSFYAVGQITKYRIMIEPLLLIIAAWIYYTATRAKRRTYFLASVGLSLAAVTSYLVLRYIF